MIKQLIFDCDGVLVDSEIIATQVMVDLLNQHRIPVDTSYYLQHCTGKTFTGLISSLSNEYGITLPDEFVQLVTAKMETTINKLLEPVAGISNLLNALELIPKAVVSNSDLYQIKTSLTKTKISHHFGEYIFSSQEVEKPKPSPQVYLYAADKLEVNSKNCLVVEDSISGASAAIAAGMEVIGFLGGSHIVKGHEDNLRRIGVKNIAYTAMELEDTINQLI